MIRLVDYKTDVLTSEHVPKERGSTGLVSLDHSILFYFLHSTLLKVLVYLFLLLFLIYFYYWDSQMMCFSSASPTGLQAP